MIEVELDEKWTEMSGSDRQRGEKRSAYESPPVVVLTVLGGLIALLGLFAAGDLGMVIVGLAAVAVAGFLHALASRK